MKPAHLILFITLLSLYSLPLLSQDKNTHSDSHKHDSHNYHVGVGIAGSKILAESTLAPGFHLHIVRQFGHHNQWGMGLGYEVIADKHWHHGLNLLFNYRPARFLSLLAGPGLAVASHEGKTEILPAFHTEAVFEFNLRGLHIGPMIGYGLDTEDSHFSVGIHLGLGF
ncbi:MAG: hypothetical protein IH597_13300 [Bacteroidales bacterium]|nr:hypothetical protein [Bacteroidales bacterium]